MRAALIRHPVSDGGQGLQITAEVRRIGRSLRLAYEVTGELAEVRWPPTAEGGRSDGLWRHTCLEAFVRVKGQAGYLELNLSPSTQWAAYAFSDHRTGMTPANAPAPELAVERLQTRFTLNADWAVDLRPDAPWSVGLSAVVEDTRGRLSYWAAAHPAGKPDFHHPDSFCFEAPPP